MSHDHEHKDSENNILRIVISLLFFISGFFYSPFYIIAYLISGYDILLCAAKNLFNKEIFDEKFLMSIATLGALGIKEYPEAVIVMILYQIGEFLQDKAIDKSKHSIEALMDIRPDYAVIDGIKIPPEEVKIGSIITVCAGERIPLDGVVVEGASSIDNSALTGESLPVEVSAGNNILSGGINLNGVLKIRVEKEYSQSTVRKILELIETSSEKKAKTEKFITKFAGIYTPIVVILAILITVLPVLINAFYINQIVFSKIWFERALTFLVISCPCALVISIPLTFFAGIGGASAYGILIKGGNYLEQLSKAGTAVFDKTGTLTTGLFGVKEVKSENPEFLKFAAIAESLSSHPIAVAIRNSYGKSIPQSIDIKEFAGKGVEVYYNGQKIKAGNADFIGADSVNQTGSVVHLSVDEVYQGYIVLSDTIKEESFNTVKLLKSMGIKTAILTGDNKKIAESVQKILGVDEVYSELLPQHKVEKLEYILSKANQPVIYIGDGINDAPVIKRADVGIAMGALGSDAAIEAADVVITDDNPEKIVTAIKIANKTIRIVKQNIIFAIGIKILFLILGVAGLMTMWGAVFADVGVAIIAILNAVRAKRI